MFFQATLLAGYAWAHITFSGFGLRRHALIQVGLVAVAFAVLAVAPLAVPAFARPPSDAPAALWLVLVLTAMVGLPFLALSSASPTTQRWFAALPGGVEPYRLFAASNAGSLIGLVAYPFLVEPNLDLPDQARWWWIGFGLFLIATVGAARIVRSKGSDLPAEASSRVDAPTNLHRLTWIAYAAVPSALLIGVTTDISTDIAAVPLLWIGPLVVYLATLILAYARPTPIGVQAAAVALLPLALAVAFRKLGVVMLPIVPSIVLLLVTLAAAGLALHGRLAAARPAPAHLTEYSLFVALGGAIGGIAAGILAPLVFVIPIEGLLVLAYSGRAGDPDRLVASARRCRPSSRSESPWWRRSSARRAPSVSTAASTVCIASPLRRPVSTSSTRARPSMVGRLQRAVRRRAAELLPPCRPPG